MKPYWPGTPRCGLYRPVTSASYAIGRALLGEGPLGGHAVNVLLHAGVTALVWLVARGVGLPPGSALSAALLFATHPLHVEAVANVAGRAEILAALGVLAAWLAHRRAVEAVAPSRRRGWAVLAALAYLLGLLSKEGAVLAPLLFLLDDRLRRRERGSVAAPTAPHEAYGGYLAAFAAGLALRWVALGGLRGAENAVFLDNPAAEMGTGPRIGTAVWVLARYAFLAVWPWRLVSDYSYDAVPVVASIADPRVLAGAGLALGLAGAFAVALGRSRATALGIASWALFLLPASNLPFAVGTVMAERVVYLPSLGACLVAGSVVAGPLGGRSRTRRVLATVAVAGVVAAFAARDLTRIPAWADNTTLALTDVEIQPASAKLQAGAAIALQVAGRRQEALTRYREALRIYPDYAQMRFDYGVLLAENGDVTAAIAQLRRAEELSPDNPRPSKALAPLLEREGRLREALAEYEAGEKLDPRDREFRLRGARALLRAGRTDVGFAALSRLVAERADDPVGRAAAAVLEERARGAGGRPEGP